MFRSGLISFVDRLSGCIQGAALLFMVLFHRASYSLPPLLKPLPFWEIPAPAPLLSDKTLAQLLDRVNWGPVFWLLFGGMVVFFAITAFLHWKNRSDGLSSFTVPVGLLILAFGVIEWFGYYADHGSVVVWPLAVIAVLVVIGFLRALFLDLARREYAEDLQRVDKTPVFGDAAEATPDDEREAGL